MKFIIVILAIITLVPTVVLALEVDFPAFGGIKPQDTFGPAQWINYIFVFALGIVGLGLIYAFTRAGIEWMLAGENSSKVSAARERIKKAIIGLLILLGSYIVLNTINPDLVNFRNPDVSFYIQGDPYVALGLKGAGGSCNNYSVCLSSVCDKSVCQKSARGGMCKVNFDCIEGTVCSGADSKKVGYCIGTQLQLPPQSSESLPANPVANPPTGGTRPAGIQTPQQ
ncbi:MAG: pilin [Patescibacteria group bacterium]